MGNAKAAPGPPAIADCCAILNAFMKPTPVPIAISANAAVFAAELPSFNNPLSAPRAEPTAEANSNCAVCLASNSAFLFSVTCLSIWLSASAYFLIISNLFISSFSTDCNSKSLCCCNKVRFSSSRILSSWKSVSSNSFALSITSIWSCNPINKSSLFFCCKTWHLI